VPQSREVEGTGKAIGETETKHGRDPTTSVLESKASIIHLVLLDLAAAQMVHAALGVDFGLVVSSSGRVGGLSSLENVEVVVCGVATTVSFSSNGGA
jgi:hypothetical protein